MTAANEESAERFWNVADKKLLNFGGELTREIICRSKGLYLYTGDGKEILDFTSGQMSCLIGHCHPEINETISHWVATLDHTFSGMVSPPVIDLAEN